MILPHLGHQLHLGSDDSAGDEKSPPRDWSHKLWPRPMGTAGTCWEAHGVMPRDIHLLNGSGIPHLFILQPRMRTRAS